MLHLCRDCPTSNPLWLMINLLAACRIEGGSFKHWCEGGLETYSTDEAVLFLHAGYRIREARNQFLHEGKPIILPSFIVKSYTLYRNM